MAKPRCDKHKRSLPYCDACKEAVRAAEEAALQAERDAVDEDEEDEEEARGKQAVLDEALREEESKALKAGVGFPGAEKQPADPEGPMPEGAPGPDAEEPAVEIDGNGNVVPVGGMFPPDEPADWGKGIDQAEATFREGDNEPPSDPIPDPWADGKTPEEGQDVGSWTPLVDEFVTIEVTAEVKRFIERIEKAIANGEEVTVVMGDAETRLRQEGRKEVIAMVREWFSDSMDTGAFKLLEHLEKKVR